MTLRIASIVALCVLLSDASRFYDGAKPAYWNEIEDNVEASKTKELHKPVEFLTRPIGFDVDRDVQLNRVQVLDILPPALMARYIVNQADWGTVATISTRKDVQSFPVANLISIADGPVGNGTGIPYMYLTPLDYTAQDLAEDHRATLLVSLAPGDYCKNKGYDPMDPRCARVMLTGKIISLKNGTEEHDVAKQLFFSRHPKLANMPASHHFFFAAMKMSAIALLDTFGGHKYVSVEDYFNPPVIYRSFLRRGRILSPFVFRPIV